MSIYIKIHKEFENSNFITNLRLKDKDIENFREKIEICVKKKFIDDISIPLIILQFKNLLFLLTL
jgi:hypothetical protein